MNNTRYLELDFYRTSYKSVKAHQYDKDTRFIKVTCVNDAAPFPLDPMSMTCDLKLKTPDGRHMFKEETIQPDGTVLVALEESMLLAAGICKAELNIYDTGSKKLLSTMPFDLIVVGSVYNNPVIESSDEFNALNNMIFYNKELGDSLTRLEADVTGAEEERAANEDIRKHNEETRVITEDSRVAAEDNRDSAESNREFNEHTRILNEDGRKDAEKQRAEDFKVLQDAINAELGKLANVTIEPLAGSDSYQIKITDKNGESTVSPNLLNILTIGSVETGDSEENPTASITGDFGSQKLNLRLPSGKPFKISKTYPSVAEMDADINNISMYEFIMINTGSVEDEDTGKLYMKDTMGMAYITDLSGVQGIQGVKGETGITPQLTVGTVTTGEAGTGASVTITGTAEKPVINFVIPKGDNVGVTGVKGNAEWRNYRTGYVEIKPSDLKYENGVYSIPSNFDPRTNLPGSTIDSVAQYFTTMTLQGFMEDVWEPTIKIIQKNLFPYTRVKGENEEEYRYGDVTLTAENIGALSLAGGIMDYGSKIIFKNENANDDVIIIKAIDGSQVTIRPNAVGIGNVAIYTDDGGGNIQIAAPDGEIWEIDAYDGNLRVFTHANGGKLGFVVNKLGQVSFPETITGNLNGGVYGYLHCHNGTGGRGTITNANGFHIINMPSEGYAGGLTWYSDEGGIANAAIGYYNLGNYYYVGTNYTNPEGVLLAHSFNATLAVNAGEKARMWTDNEGGNISLQAPDGAIWEMDAYNGGFRLFTYENGVRTAFSVDKFGRVTFPGGLAMTGIDGTPNGLQYILGIDAFQDGGTVRWIDRNNLTVGRALNADAVNGISASYLMELDEKMMSNNDYKSWVTLYQPKCYEDSLMIRHGNPSNYSNAIGPFFLSAAHHGVFLSANDTDYVVGIDYDSPQGGIDYGYFGPANYYSAGFPIDLGHPSYGKWRNIYAQSGSIITSDRNEKTGIKPLDDELIEQFFMGLLPSSYGMKDGTSGRTHWGLVAQDIEELMECLGIDSKDFAGFIKSPVYEEYDAEEEVEVEKTVPDEDGTPTPEKVTEIKKVRKRRVVPGKYNYGLRYEEFIAPIIKFGQILYRKYEAQQEEIKGLKKENLELREKLVRIEKFLGI